MQFDYNPSCAHDQFMSRETVTCIGRKAQSEAVLMLCLHEVRHLLLELRSAVGNSNISISQIYLLS